MNSTFEPHRCPACSTEIPSEAPQGLCPKCLLMGVASLAVPPASSSDSVYEPASSAGEPTPRGLARTDAKDRRPAPPSVEQLAAAFPQLEIMELIGRGGMGFVYKARQPKLDRLVALKILPGHLATEPSFQERFEREARVLAKLQHPLIVSVYDFGEAAIVDRSPTVVRSLRRPDAESRSDEAALEPSSASAERHSDAGSSFFYLMLEYVDGVNLREAMRAGRFTPDQALAIVPQVCEALQYAHSKGVLHRDIKPENILLDTDGRVKIADFGIAKVLGPEIDSASSQLASAGASESEMAVTRLTATGSVLGTPLYMAPEQLINPNSVDHRADIFSLGVVFYEMLTGELPMGRFAAPSEKALANQSIDQRIDEVVLRALAKERELRQQSADEMKTEVETIASNPRRKPTSPLFPSPVAAVEPPNSTASPIRTMGTSSGRGGWWALASLFLGCFLAVLPMMGFRSQGNSAPAQLSVFGLMLLVAVILLTVSGFVVPPLLGWWHLLRQRRDHSHHGIIPALIAAYFLPLLVLDSTIFWGIFASLEQLRRQLNPREAAALMTLAQYAATALCLIVDGTILYATWCWVTHAPLRLPSSAKFSRLWTPVAFVLGWTLLSVFGGWCAFEAVQSYGRYNFRRVDESVDHLAPKSGGYVVRGGVQSYTDGRGMRSKPLPSRALWEMIFLSTSETNRLYANAVVELPGMQLRALHPTNPYDNYESLTEATLLARMRHAGIDVDRMEVAAEARSLVLTAQRLSDALRRGERLNLAGYVDHQHWKVHPIVNDMRLPFVRHGWDFMERSSNEAIDVRVKEDDALLAMSSVVAFWLIGLAWLLGRRPVRLTDGAVPMVGHSSESLWPRRCRWLFGSLAALVAIVPLLLLASMAVKPNFSQPSLVTASPPEPVPIKSGSEEPRPPISDANRPSTTMCAAVAEAKRLGLIRVADFSSDAPRGLPLTLTGSGGPVSVEPHFSALVELPEPTKELGWSFQGGTQYVQAAYPCDYIACDWTADESKPVILGYVRSPGAFDFRADAETSKHLNTASSGSRAELAAGAWKLVPRSLQQTSATESDWQQATQAAHVRMKFVPKSISKLEVPDECLVVLTEDSRIVFTRKGGRFTKWELPTTEPIRELREAIHSTGTLDAQVDVKELLDQAHRAVRQQNWEELLNCLTDDCRSEWMLEITSGCELVLEQLQVRGSVTEPKSLAAMSTLIQLQQELKKFKREIEPLEAKRLDLRFKSYSTLSAAEQRQFRIDVFQASYDLPGKFGDYYESRVRLPSTILTFVQQLNESQLVIDLSTVSDLHVEDNRATGTWMSTDRTRTPITLRRVGNRPEDVRWKIDSLIGKSVLDAPFPGFPIPAGIMLESQTDSPHNAPADATVPENTTQAETP